MNDLQLALTFDDILLVPNYAEVLPKDVDTRTQLTRELSLNVPLISSAMDTVTESPMAIAMAELGGIGILHMCMSIEDQARHVRAVKTFESGVVNDPMTISPDARISDVVAITQSHRFSGLPVVDNEQVVGIITNRDIRFVENMEDRVSELMTPKDLSLIHI